MDPGVAAGHPASAEAGAAVLAGLSALHERFGRLVWADVCAPALALARDGVEMPPAHAACLLMLAPVMTLDRGAEIYAPGGALLESGDSLRQPGLERALALLADEGARSAYDGSIAEAILDLERERGGAVTRDDLATYNALWNEPVRV